jgi:F-type H+-transporting ATPase subunit gamma
MSQLQRSLIHSLEGMENGGSLSTFFTRRSLQKERIVVLTSDRGSCGSYNANIVKKAENVIHRPIDWETEIVSIGVKGYETLKRKFSVNQYLPRANFETKEHLKGFLKEATSDFNAGHFDKLTIIYSHFKSMMVSEVRVVTLFPIYFPNELAGEEGSNKTLAGSNEFIFEPARSDFVHPFLETWVLTTLQRMVLESLTSENVSRMIAMEAASKNCRELISSMKLHYNRLRQAHITKELLEIIGSAEAMK